jgi:NADH pyrophosphatase NudC (nudix superfamily)
MSFNYHPYEHIELIHHDDGGWSPYCHSCGAELKTFPSTEPVATFALTIGAHIMKRHGYFYKDFNGWSKH